MATTPIAGQPRTAIVAGNWKMHLTAQPAIDAVRALLAGLSSADGQETAAGEVWVFPPFTALWPLRAELAGQTKVRLGAQDVHWLERGAFTGEVSAAMLVDAGCSAVLIGHSERRSLFGETDATVALKTAAALAAGLQPVVCVGESRSEREAGKMAEVLNRQVSQAVAGLAADAVGRLVFAYEPVWAIGTGLAAAAADAVAAAGTIRDALPAQVREAVRVLYGGSVKTENVADFMRQPSVDGVLVGGASLDGASFAALARAGLGARPR